ncbi:low molecular weight protein arginine phosphatase [soil metagenome]
MVCTGNLCRSPMATGLMRHALAERSCGDVEVVSAGTWAQRDSKATTEAVTVLADRGVDLTRHRSRPLTRSDLEDADLIVAMTSEHVGEILDLAPEVELRVVLLKALAEMDVSELDADASRADRLRALLSAARPQPLPAHDLRDPIGASLRTYATSATEISEAVDVLVTALCGPPSTA